MVEILVEMCVGSPTEADTANANQIQKFWELFNVEAIGADLCLDIMVY